MKRDLLTMVYALATMNAIQETTRTADMPDDAKEYLREKLNKVQLEVFDDLEEERMKMLNEAFKVMKLNE